MDVLDFDPERNNGINVSRALAELGPDTLSWYQGDVANHFMQDLFRANNLVTAAIEYFHNTGSTEAIRTVYERDTRKMKYMSVAYMRAIRTALYENDAVLAEHLLREIYYEVDMLLDAVEIDYPKSLERTESIESTAYVAIITAMKKQAIRDDKAVISFVALECFVSDTPAMVAANLYLADQGWFYLSDYDAWFDEIMWAMEERFADNLIRSFRAFYGVASLFRNEMNRNKAQQMLINMISDKGTQAKNNLSTDDVEEIIAEALEDAYTPEQREKKLRSNKTMAEIYSRRRGKIDTEDDLKALQEEVDAADLGYRPAANFQILIHDRYKLRW